MVLLEIENPSIMERKNLDECYTNLILSYNKIVEKYNRQESHIKKLEKMHFGPRTEKMPLEIPEQTRLELGETIIPHQSKVVVETKKVLIKKTREVFGKEELPTHLERRFYQVPLDVEVKIAIEEGRADLIETLIKEELHLTPAKPWVLQIHRQKYIVHPAIFVETQITNMVEAGKEIAVVEQRGNVTASTKVSHGHSIHKPQSLCAIDNKIIAPPAFSTALQKSQAGHSILVYLIIQKYFNHMPLYRLMRDLQRQGLRLKYPTVIGWLKEVTQLLHPLQVALRKKISQSMFLMSDDTHVQVLESEKKGKSHRGYFWLFSDGTHVEVRYSPSRSQITPIEYLSDWNGGVLLTDAYAGYNNVKSKNSVIHAYCWAHARRKFVEALEAGDKDACFALRRIRYLYRVSNLSKSVKLGDPIFEQIKLKYARLAQMLAGMKKGMVRQLRKGTLPKSDLGRANSYTLNCWDGLLVFLDHPEVSLDNNLSERCIRDVVIGRKNWMFCGNHESAQDAALFISLAASCKLHGIDFEAYMSTVLRVIGDWKITRIDELLPGNIKLLPEPQYPPL